MANEMAAPDLVKKFVERAGKDIALSMELFEINERIDLLAQKIFRDVEVVKAKQQRRFEIVTWLTMFLFAASWGLGLLAKFSDRRESKTEIS